VRELLRRAADEAAAFRDAIVEGPVTSTADLADVRSAFSGPLNDAPRPPNEVLEELIAAAKGGLMATPGPRFFGFVIGGALPAATAADMLAAGWDQCAFNPVLAPAATAAEEAAGGWLKELLGIPATASVGFVTGAQAANTVGLAAARHHVLAEAGWDVEKHGLLGAPRIRVVAGEERHATVDRSLRLIGLGSDLVEPVRATDQGTIDVAHLAEVLAAGERGPVIVCLQAGNVNTGGIDDLRGACEVARRGARLLERRLDAVGDEVEGRAALHRQRVAGVVGEDEDIGVERRLVAPPALPRLLPGARAAAEHVAAHDDGADALGTGGGGVRVDPRFAALVAVRCTPAGGLQHPVVQALAALAQGLVGALVRTRDVAVEGDGDLALDRAHVSSRSMAATERSTSASVVDQLETEIRM
jgi:hypothetical protein